MLTVTALCCLLGVCVAAAGSNVFSDTIRIMMLVCTVVLGVATIGLLVAKVQEIRALREIIRSEDAQQQSEAETPARSWPPADTGPYHHRASAAAGHPGAGCTARARAGQQPKTKQGRSKKRGRAMEQPAAETMARRSPCCSPLRWCPHARRPAAPLYSKRRSSEQPSVERVEAH